MWGVVNIGGICTPPVCLYAPCNLYTYVHMLPDICMPLHTPSTSVCSPYIICSPYFMGTWEHLYTPYVFGSFRGASVYLSNISVSAGTSICPSVHNRYTSCSPSFRLFPYWTRCLWMCAMLHIVYLFLSLYWITYQASWHSGQCCVQMSWELSLYFGMCLVLLPCSIVRSGLHSSPFFTVSRVWFLLVRLSFMPI